MKGFTVQQESYPYTAHNTFPAPLKLQADGTKHKVKWRHRIYGHKTIAILWVQRDIMCGVNGWSFIAALQ